MLFLVTRRHMVAVEFRLVLSFVPRKFLNLVWPVAHLPLNVSINHEPPTPAMSVVTSNFDMNMVSINDCAFARHCGLHVDLERS